MKCRKSKIFEHVRKNRRFFRTKGQGLSLNTIIIAAIVLIVLVVLWAIFTGRMGMFTRTLEKETTQKKCAEIDLEEVVAADCPADRQVFGNYDVKSGYICCKPVP